MQGADTRLAFAAQTPPIRGTSSTQCQVRRFCAAALAVVIGNLALGGGSAAFAQDAAIVGGWQFNVSPYLRAAGLSGEAGTLRPLPHAEVDLSFSDILDDLRFAGTVAGSARKGRFGLTADIQDAETRSDDVLGPLFQNTSVTSKSFLATVIAKYAVIDTRGATLFVGVGLRVWSVDSELKLSGGLGGATRRIEDDDTWVDPILILRGDDSLSDRWFLAGWTGVGGFGVGSDFAADMCSARSGTASRRRHPCRSATAG